MKRVTPRLVGLGLLISIATTLTALNAGCELMRSCEDISNELSGVLARARTCVDGDTCVSENVSRPCVPELVCGGPPINANVDLEAYESDIDAALAGFSSSKCGCAMADCLSPEDRVPMCDVESGQCIYTP